MNRRKFFAGLFGVGAAAVAPKVVSEPTLELGKAERQARLQAEILKNVLDGILLGVQRMRGTNGPSFESILRQNRDLNDAQS